MAQTPYSNYVPLWQNCLHHFKGDIRTLARCEGPNKLPIHSSVESSWWAIEISNLNIGLLLSIFIRMCKFFFHFIHLKLTLFFFFYTLTFIKHSHQFVYYIYIYSNKIFNPHPPLTHPATINPPTQLLRMKKYNEIDSWISKNGGWGRSHSIIVNHANSIATHLVIRLVEFQSLSEDQIPIAHLELVRSNLNTKR